MLKTKIAGYLYLFLFICSIGNAKSNDSILQFYHHNTEKNEHIEISKDTFVLGTKYFATAAIFNSLSSLTNSLGTICSVFPFRSSVQKELFLASDLVNTVSLRCFSQTFKVLFSNVEKSLPSYFFWNLNNKLLSKVPTFTNEDKNLIAFLQRRYLTKSSGYYSLLVDFLCPCFDIALQVHPETTHSYSRLITHTLSMTYKNRVATLKGFLPHPESFPLVLARPYKFQKHLPSHIAISKDKTMQNIVDELEIKMDKGKIVLDFTDLLDQEDLDRNNWLDQWHNHQKTLFNTCQNKNLDLSKLVCIHRINQDQISGIRLLPFNEQPVEQTTSNHQFLLEWISGYGLSANIIELDRLSSFSNTLHEVKKTPVLVNPYESKDKLLSYLLEYEKNWACPHPQKTLMIKGTLNILKGLLIDTSNTKWEQVFNCPTRSSIAELAINKIKKQFSYLKQHVNNLIFFDVVTSVEQIHADFASLLEIFSPFIYQDFASIYLNALKFIPENLQPLTSTAIHTSGMTSTAATIAAAEKMKGKTPNILYDTGTYFECIDLLNRVANPCCIENATKKDWKQADLLLLQFSPALKHLSLPIIKYDCLHVIRNIHRAVNAKKGKPLSVAIDCTTDYINSPKVKYLLNEFEKEIKAGILNIICFRSGAKFDLFGMDNYCGAPFYMLHNQDTKWDAFDFVLKDTSLQSDPLSINWFSNAYKHAADQLDLYRKQIFDNTRAVLNNVPKRLLSPNSSYRIIPCEKNLDLAFIDIRICGPLHQIRGSALVAGSLLVNCMEKKHPIFFRSSIGYTHPNFTMLFTEDSTIIRLTVGLDPDQIQVITGTFKQIDLLND